MTLEEFSKIFNAESKFVKSMIILHFDRYWIYNANELGIKN